MLATASLDSNAALVGFKTGEQLYKGKTPDEGNFLIVHKGNLFSFNY